MKFTATVTQHGNILLSPKDRERLLKKKAPNSAIKVEVKGDRSLPQNGMYWLLMAALEFHFGETKELWHTYFKCQFLQPEEFVNQVTGVKMLFPPSTAFHKLNNQGFNAYFNHVQVWLAKGGYDWQELIHESQITDKELDYDSTEKIRG